MYLEEYLGIKIGNINLERVHFPKEFTETKIKIQQNHYNQLQLNVENETNILKYENDQKLIKIKTDTESKRVLVMADTNKREVEIKTEAECNKITQLAKAQALELELLNKAIVENKESYKLKILTLSKDAWVDVAKTSGSKLIISGGGHTSDPLDFITNTMITKEVFAKE
jgi:hypothetical protein